MNRLSTRDPIAILRDMELRSHANASGLPQQELIVPVWTGIAFRVGESNMLADGQDVLEILHYPQITRVPGTLHWVKGIANVRGNLLPIMDLSGFLFNRYTPIERQTRVLVINPNGLYVGLIVNEVFGQRHFEDDDRVAFSPADSHISEADALQAYSKAAFRSDGATWRVMDMNKLAIDQNFLRVAV